MTETTPITLTLADMGSRPSWVRHDDPGRNEADTIVDFALQAAWETRDYQIDVVAPSPADIAADIAEGKAMHIMALLTAARRYRPVGNWGALNISGLSAELSGLSEGRAQQAFELRLTRGCAADDAIPAIKHDRG